MNYDLPQKVEFLFHPKRMKGIRGGRGSAKSWSVARALLIKGAMGQERILCTREIQKSLAQSVHQLLEDQITAMNLQNFYTVQKTTIIGKNGTEFFFGGLSDVTIDGLKSFEGASIVWVEEGQTVTASSWKVLIPTIRRDNSEIWVTYNPELASDATHQLLVVKPSPDTVCVEMNWRDNPWFPDVLKKERLHAQLTMSEEDYNHVWEGMCMPAVTGAIYFNEVSAAEKMGRICNVPIDPILQTHAVWDLGWNDKMSIILAQKHSSEIRIVDYVEDSHRVMSDYILDLQARKLSWGSDWIPHDGYAKEFRIGTSAEQILRSMGRNPEPVPNTEVEAGIKSVRLCFPRMYFDQTRCALLIERLRRYRRNVNKATQEATTPMHDENSHGADTVRYLALTESMMTNNMTAAPTIKYRRRTVA
jgi:phage terminase large subunit